MTPFKYFNKVAKNIGFEYSPSSVSPHLYDFIKHNMFTGALLIQNKLEKKLENIFYLLTNKFIVREKFYTILFSIKLEILNTDFLIGDENTWEVFSLVKEYSYMMKDDKNIQDYDLNSFSILMKDKFRDMYSDFEKNLFSDIPEYTYIIKNISKNRIERINNISGVEVGGENPMLLASLNLALEKEI